MIKHLHFLERPIEESVSVNNNPDVEICKAFINNTCGCTLVKGTTCSSIFHASHRLQASGLGNNGILNVSCKQHQDGKHKACEKECTFCNYQVCQVTYRFLLGIGKHRLKAIKAQCVQCHHR